MFVRPRPDAEFFHVIAHGGHATRVDGGGIAQIGDDVFDLAEGNEIAESFLPRVKPHGLATVFGNVGAKEFLDRKSTRLNSSHTVISYAVFCLKKKKIKKYTENEK